MKQDLVRYLQERIDIIELDLKDECLENDLNFEESSWYDTRLDEYGTPYSHGNSNDVFSDGHDMGERDGELSTLKSILELIK